MNHTGIVFNMWQVIFDFDNKEFPFTVLTEAPAWSEVCFFSKWRHKISHVCRKNKVMIKRDSLFWYRLNKLWSDLIKCFQRPLSTICMHVRALNDWILTKQWSSLFWSFGFLYIINITSNNNNSFCVGLTIEGSVSSRSTHCYGYDSFAILDYKLNSYLC